MEIREHAPLGPHTTFQIGGEARFFVRAESVEEVREALAFAQECGVGVRILGGSSNVLVDDRGFPGLIIQNGIKGIHVEHEVGGVVLVAGAGERWDALVEYAVNHDWWGIENLSGIPGTTGAAPIQNIGAYGSELKDTLVWVEVLDRTTGEIVRMHASACQFSYRSSIFKLDVEKYIVVRVALRLKNEGIPNIVYKDLALAFVDTVPTLVSVREAVLVIRAQKFPNLAVEGTAGSFFLNPTVSFEKAAELAIQFPELPQYSALGGKKMSLAWLLDHALSLKGVRIGGARLFEKQPLVIVASRATSSKDVLLLATLVQKTVLEKFGITIETEVQLIS